MLEDVLNKVVCIDCVEGLKLVKNSIDLVLTSPPYDDMRDYNGYSFDFPAVAKGIYDALKQDGICVWVVGDKTKNGDRTLSSFRQAIAFQEIGFKVHDVMIYKKLNTPFMRSNAYTNCFEFMFVLAKGKVKTFNPLQEHTVRNGYEMLVSGKGSDAKNNKVVGRLNEKKTRTNIWEYAVGLGGSTSDKIAFRHPAIFPENLARDHIISWTNQGDVVLDPFCGSGTTLKMAKMEKRNYVGFDISKEYCQLAKERLCLVSEQLF